LVATGGAVRERVGLRSAFARKRKKPQDGRVLGYDNSRNGHHRHFMGNVQPVRFTDYQSLARRFHEEVRALETGR
jgi:hypothetical protein